MLTETKRYELGGKASLELLKSSSVDRKLARPLKVSQCHGAPGLEHLMSGSSSVRSRQCQRSSQNPGGVGSLVSKR